MEILRVNRWVATCLRSRIATTILVALGLMLAPGGATAAEESVEYAVKAAFLYKFGFFVEWPAAAFASPTSAFRLCVVGEDPFGATLDKAVSGQQVGNRAVEVRRLKTAGRDSGCHVLYISASEAPRLGPILEALRGSSVLTVTDGRVPAPTRGIIHFVVSDDRVRFEVDDEAAAQNSLAISSKLMSLAINARRRTPREPPK